jgi:hypothetical protein
MHAIAPLQLPPPGWVWTPPTHGQAAGVDQAAQQWLACVQSPVCRHISCAKALQSKVVDEPLVTHLTNSKSNLHTHTHNHQSGEFLYKDDAPYVRNVLVHR